MGPKIAKLNTREKLKEHKIAKFSTYKYKFFQQNHIGSLKFSFYSCCFSFNAFRIPMYR